MSGASQGLPCPSFLTLPREIRDEIYVNLFLQSESTLPSKPWAGWDWRGEEGLPLFDRFISYKDTLPHVPSLPLLACCRQIRQETQAILARKDIAEQRGATVYKLHCMMGLTNVWPTWIRLPNSLACVHVLEVDFRFLGPTIQPWKVSSFHFESVFFLLARLLRQGACLKPRTTPPPPIHIDLLVIIIQPASLPRYGSNSDEGDVNEEASRLRIEKIWAMFLKLESAELLSNKIGRLRLRCGTWAKEVHVCHSSMNTDGVGPWEAWWKQNQVTFYDT